MKSAKHFKGIEKGLSNKQLQSNMESHQILFRLGNKAKYFKALEDNLSLFSEKRGNQMQDLINKFGTLLRQEKLENVNRR